jgi:hypothetical protein
MGERGMRSQVSGEVELKFLRLLSNGLRDVRKTSPSPLIRVPSLSFYRPRERHGVTRVKRRKKGKEERDKQRRGP